MSSSENNKKKRSINDVLLENSSKHHWRTNINTTDELIFEFVPECNELEYDKDDKSSVGTCGKGVALAMGNTIMRTGKHFLSLSSYLGEWEETMACLVLEAVDDQYHFLLILVLSLNITFSFLLFTKKS